MEHGLPLLVEETPVFGVQMCFFPSKQTAGFSMAVAKPTPCVDVWNAVMAAIEIFHAPPPFLV